jgi:F0F1-type ATP synthase membrane subunit c/vacuolar-type H+-ATPase subunit K
VVNSPELVHKYAGLLLGIGISGGLGELFSAWLQGVIGAAGCRCLSESDGKGLALIIIALGIVETVGIFSFVFLYMAIGKLV